MSKEYSEILPLASLGGDTFCAFTDVVLVSQTDRDLPRSDSISDILFRRHFWLCSGALGGQASTFKSMQVTFAIEVIVTVVVPVTAGDILIFVT